MGFSRIGAISQKGDCRPFDAKADGFLQGDGCGVVILKELSAARADGDRIYAVIRGSGVNNDAGQSSGPMAPSLEGQQGAIRAAVRDADIDPATIDFVSCHGTATPVGDPVEVGALRAVRGQADTPVYLGSVKGNIGHTMSAAGVAGLLHAVLALHHETITPQAGYDTPHPELGLDDGSVVVPTQAIPWKRRAENPRRAGVSSFGFGGTNCHLIIEEPPSAAETAAVEGPHVVVLAAASPSLLAGYAERIADSVGGMSLADVAFTLSATRSPDKSRLAIVAADTDELVDTLRRAAQTLRATEDPPTILGPDAFYGVGDADGVAFMFGGQGSQRLGLARDAFQRFEGFAGHLRRIWAGAEDVVGAPIEDLLYPADENEAASDRLKSTQVCQPVMAALALAQAAFLRDLGVKAKCTLGHSLGEFAAAAAGEMMSDVDAVRFVARRGQLMAALEVDDFGAMAAVMASPSEVKPLLADGAVVANINHPQQTVISGATTAVESTTAALTSAGIKVTTLRVSHAFHSPIVAPMKADLAAVIDELDLSAPECEVVSAITGQAYGDDVAQTRATFVEHTTSSVDFVSAVRLAAKTASTFVELGSSGALTAFVRGSVEDASVISRPLSARKPDAGRELQRAIALLAARGIDVDFAQLHPRRAVVSLPAPPLQRTRHWVVRDKVVPLEVPESSKGSPIGVSVSDQGNTPDSALVALFREQTELLRRQAEIIAAQTAALGGQPIPASEVPALPTATVAPVADPVTQAGIVEPAPDVVDEPAESAADYTSIVRDAVASVSAFPVEALGNEQQLAQDLGFDSLMFVDLAADLQKRVPGLEIPQAAFDQSTTIADVIDFLQNRESTGTVATTEPIELGDVVRYRVEWAEVKSRGFPGRVFTTSSVAIVAAEDDSAAVELRDAFLARSIEASIVTPDDDVAGSSIVDLSLRGRPWSVKIVQDLRNRAVSLGESGDAFVVVTSSDDEAAVRGAARGFAKAIGREWSSVRSLSIETDDVASAVIAELDAAQQLPEVRWVDGARFAPRLIEDSAPEAELAIADDEVVMVTGGARGIARACVEALIAKTDARFVLVGRSESADIASLGERASYVSWDVSQPAPAQVRELGVTTVIHVAGLIRDAAVTTKTDEDIAAVVGVKVDGLRNVIDAVADTATRFIGFGSWAGRFGNAHQCDYAAANDAMSEILSQLDEHPAVSGTAIDWPIWEGSAMGDSIPESLRNAMLARGVTFISDDEGVDALLRGGNAGGEILFGRSMGRRDTSFESSFEASLDNMPYVADHVVRGAPIVPMAGALDMLAAGAAAASGADAIVMRDVTLFKGLDLSTPNSLSVRATSDRGRGTAEIEADGELAYRAQFTATDADLAGLAPTLEGDPVAATLDLEHFYRDVAFHGPRIQGITKIEGIAPQWIVGRVKTSTPASLHGPTERENWTVDPLVVDAAMQLVLFHLKSLHGFGAIPFAIDEYAQVRPFRGDWVRCSMVLDDMSDGVIVGTIGFEDEDGLAAVMTRLRAKEFHDDAEDKPAEVDPKFWDIAKWTEVEELEQRLQMADLIGIRNPYFWPHDGPARNTAIVDGREMINYSSYNYCGFSGHPDVSKAAQDAVARYGTSVSASRIASGQIPLHTELEQAIADFIGTEATLVFAAGHMTNETVIGHVFGKNDLIIHDSLAHNSILTGAELSGAKRMSFPHSDWKALDRTLTKLRGNFEKVGIFIEGVYSMDGDIPDLPRFIDVKRKHRALLYVDEAHSIGVIGPRGAGISDYFGVDPMDVDIWMGTLSKAFASCGGYITGSQQLITYLKYTAPAFVFSAGISPANAAAACAACKLLAASPEIPKTLQARADYFVELCQARGIDTGMSKDSAVVPAIVGNSIECLKLSGRLAERGINVQPIVYPAVDDESSRLRFFLSAVHTEENLRQTVDILAEELDVVRSGAAAE